MGRIRRNRPSVTGRPAPPASDPHRAAVDLAGVSGPEYPRSQAGSAAVSDGATVRTAETADPRWPASMWFRRHARETGLPLGVTRHRARATFIQRFWAGSASSRGSAGVRRPPPHRHPRGTTSANSTTRSTSVAGRYWRAHKRAIRSAYRVKPTGSRNSLVAWLAGLGAALFKIPISIPTYIR